MLFHISLVPRLSWNVNIISHNFNVRVPECGSLGTRLVSHGLVFYQPHSQSSTTSMYIVACSIRTASNNSCGMRTGKEASVLHC